MANTSTAPAGGNARPLFADNLIDSAERFMSAARAAESNVTALPTAGHESVRQSWRGRYPKNVARLSDARDRRRERNDMRETINARSLGSSLGVSCRGGVWAAAVDGGFTISKQHLRNTLMEMLDALDRGQWDGTSDFVREAKVQ